MLSTFRCLRAGRGQCYRGRQCKHGLHQTRLPFARWLRAMPEKITLRWYDAAFRREKNKEKERDKLNQM